MARRKSYTPEQRKTILTTALRDRLTAADVRKKFGVTPVTYYSWRKKMGAARRRGTVAVAAVAAGVGGFEVQLREQVRQSIRTLLPEIVRSEVNSYLGEVFARRGGRRRI
jgi:transposase-like protein